MEENLTNKELLTAHRVLSKIMKTNNLCMDNSFVRVRSWIANKLCDQLEDGEILETLK